MPSYDERLSLLDIKDLKKRLTENVFLNKKGKFVIDYSKYSNSVKLILPDGNR